MPHLFISLWNTSENARVPQGNRDKLPWYRGTTYRFRLRAAGLVRAATPSDRPSDCTDCVLSAELGCGVEASKEGGGDGGRMGSVMSGR